MFVKLMGALFAPKYPKFYTGRHRARARLRMTTPRMPVEQSAELA